MPASYKPDFKGSGVLFLNNVFLYILVTAPFLSFCLMGAKWLHVFLGMITLVLPFALVVGLLVSRFDGFSFDDDEQQVVRPFQRRIPYRAIKRIELNETGRLLQASIKEGALKRTPFMYALDVKEKTRLLTELLKRFPLSVIQEKKYADWKSLIVIMAAVVLMTTGFHAYFYRGNSLVGAAPRTVVWAGEERPTQDIGQYSAGSFRVAVPRHFHLLANEGDALLFEDVKTKTEVKYVADPGRDLPAPKGDFIRYVTGLGDYFDVLETAYTARVGIIPLALKELALTGLTDISILTIRKPSITGSTGKVKKGRDESASLPQPALKGFATQGRKKENELTAILLTDSEQREELHILISGRRRLDEKALQGIVAGVSMSSR